MTAKDFTEWSYRRHSEHLPHELDDPERLRIHETWFSENNAAAWLEARQYEIADIFSCEPDAAWITIGDGMYGLDSIRMRKYGLKNVTPSDIKEPLLKRAKEKELISEYLILNAEHMDLPDSSADYIFCKDSYHHLPRPVMGLYEMLRVVRKAVVLCEPADRWDSPLRRIFFGLKKILGIQQHFDQKRFEEVGNYIYTITVREMEKVALGLSFPMIAYKFKSHIPMQGYEFARRSFTDKVFFKMRLLMTISQWLSFFHLHSPEQLHVILFKELPQEAVLKKLKSNRWKIVRLPENPYAGEKG